MAIMRIECPECGAGLKSPTGFKPGQSVACPKCETYFTVEEPEEDEDRPAKKKAVKAVASRTDDDDDDDDEKPRKKKKKKRRDDDDDDDDEGSKKSYATSPLRFIVLGILVVIMVVLGIMLIMKKRDEKDNANAVGDPPAVQPSGPQGNVPPAPFGGPPGGLGGAQPFPGLVNPGGPPPNGVVPKKGGFTAPKKDFNQPGLAGGPDPIAGLIGEAPRPGTAESIQLLETHRKKLLGNWEGSTREGAVHKVSYQDNGKYTHEVTGGAKASSSTGTWNISGLVGTRGVKINRGDVTLKAVFEGDELLHDTTTPGETVVLRKK